MKTQLINPFCKHNLNKSVGIKKSVLITDEIDLSSDLTVINSGINNAHYLKQIVSTSRKHFVGLPRNDLMSFQVKLSQVFPRYVLEDLSL